MAEMVVQGLSSGTYSSFSLIARISMLKHHLTYQIGLKGEALSLHSLSGSSSVEWVQGSLMAQGQPLTWYKVSIFLTLPPCSLNFRRQSTFNNHKSIILLCSHD